MRIGRHHRLRATFSRWTFATLVLFVVMAGGFNSTFGAQPQQKPPPVYQAPAPAQNSRPGAVVDDAAQCKIVKARAVSDCASKCQKFQVCTGQVKVPLSCAPPPC